jgi:hypothetical protein
MKTQHTLFSGLLVFCAFLYACTKTENIQPTSKMSVNAVKIQLNPYTIINLAGSSFGSNLVDGPGNLARFWNPQGIQVKPGGILYVADYMNNAIRKIVVQPLNGNRNQFSATVSTLNTPAGPNGLKLTLPFRVGVSDNGTINTLFHATGSNNSFVILGRIYKPSGTIYTVQTDFNGYFGLTEDLSGRFFWCISNQALGKFWSDHIQTPNFNLSPDSLKVYYAGTQFLFSNASLVNIYACPDGNLYLSTSYQFFKLSRLGVLTKIPPIAEYPDLPFQTVTDMVVSDDGKTIYFTDNWKIRKLQDGKVTTLVYPTGTLGSGGIEADIHASGLGLDDKQHILYFTDLGAVKILTLPGYVAH